MILSKHCNNLKTFYTYLENFKMKKLIIPVLAGLTLTISGVAKANTGNFNNVEKNISVAPTAKEVIDNYIKALGGKDKLEAVKTVILEQTMTVQGMDVSMVTKKMGNKFKSVQSVMGQEMTQVFDGEKGYANQMGTKMDLPADKIGDLKKAKVIDALSFDPATFTKVEAQKVDGKDYNVLTSDKGKYYFDAVTGLLYKTETKEATVVVKNYMTVDGIKFPSDIDANGQGQNITIKTSKVTLNSGVTDADFK